MDLFCYNLGNGFDLVQQHSHEHSATLSGASSRNQTSIALHNFIFKRINKTPRSFDTSKKYNQK